MLSLENNVIWELLTLGIGISLLLMLPLSIKWKLPKMTSWMGAVAVSTVATLPFLPIYPLLETNREKALGVLGQIALSLTFGFTIIMLRFWRDPERATPEEDGVVLSAADGKVLYVKTVDKGVTPLVSKDGKDYRLTELTGTNILASNVYIIGVEMSILDVHVNRCPISGQVKLLKHINGQFMSLGKKEAPFINARHTTIIENISLSVAVVQVASRLVRRVENYLNPGETVFAGQRLGMIRFGSLVGVILPLREDIRIQVKPGDRVMAGVSVLARYNDTSRSKCLIE